MLPCMSHCSLKALAALQNLQSGQGSLKGPLKVFAGNAHPKLAQDICSIIGVPLSPVTLKPFKNGEINCSAFTSCLFVKLLVCFLQSD